MREAPPPGGPRRTVLHLTSRLRDRLSRYLIGWTPPVSSGSRGVRRRATRAHRRSREAAGGVLLPGLRRPANAEREPTSEPRARGVRRHRRQRSKRESRAFAERAAAEHPPGSLTIGGRETQLGHPVRGGDRVRDILDERVFVYRGASRPPDPGVSLVEIEAGQGRTRNL